MSVRVSKSKIILYVIGIFSFLIVILICHDTSQKLDDTMKSYSACSLSEKSLLAQLQVNLEYKVRLEKSLQQEKSEHSQIKDDLQRKLEEERQARERENSESFKKFTALQQKYKFLQSQHEDANNECSKLRQLQLSELEEKSRLETQLQVLKNELKLVKENKDNDIRLLKEKNHELQNENAVIKTEKIKLLNDLNLSEKQKRVDSQIKLSEKLSSSPLAHKLEGDLTNLQQSELRKFNISSTRSSTSANKAEQELFPSAHNIYTNTSTPMINPDAVMSFKILKAAPVPQPRQESFQNFQIYENKENVGAKPEELVRQGVNEENLLQGVLHAPDIMNNFIHVPAVMQYKEKMKQAVEKNNNGGEVGDEGEPLNKNPEIKEKRPWREGEVDGVPFVRHAAGNNLSKNDVYQYQMEYEGKKEEGEDDDDFDPMDYQHVNEKNQQLHKKANVGAHMKIPFEDKHESVIIQPKIQFKAPRIVQKSSRATKFHKNFTSIRSKNKKNC